MTQATKMLKYLIDGNWRGNMEIAEHLGNGEPCSHCGRKPGVALRLTDVTHKLRKRGVDIQADHVEGGHWRYRLLTPPHHITFTPDGFDLEPTADGEQCQLSL